jgi:thiamine-monophosphate kinase
LQRHLPGPPAGETWIGDDAAVLDPFPGPLLFTTDMSVGGVHADLDVMGLDDLGWRAVAAAVSDIAAMGGRAHHVLVAVAGPPSTDIDRLYQGVAGAARAHGCRVVGGDLSNARDVVVVVSVTGTIPDGPGPVLRSGARSGDHLLVTGPLGASAAGLRLMRTAPAGAGPGDGRSSPLVLAHRRPRARRAGGEAARRAGASAMVDVSDGLAADLGHLADASSVGFRLDEVPVAGGATLQEALTGGEDYALVFAAPDADGVMARFEECGLSLPTIMGECRPDVTERTLGGAPLPPAGWVHSWT